MRAAVMPAPNAPIEVRDLPVPPLAPGAVLLETIASEVCGTDVHLWHGRLAGVPYPIVPGHVSVGRIAAFGGSDADRPADLEGKRFQAGDIVTFLDVHGTCGACWYCLVAGQSTRCPKRRVYGITMGVADGPSGGWAEAILMKPGTHLKFTYNNSDYHKKMAIFAASEWKTKLNLETDINSLEFKVLVRKRHDNEFQIARHG